MDLIQLNNEGFMMLQDMIIPQTPYPIQSGDNLSTSPPKPPLPKRRRIISSSHRITHQRRTHEISEMPYELCTTMIASPLSDDCDEAQDAESHESHHPVGFPRTRRRSSSRALLPRPPSEFFENDDVDHHHSLSDVPPRLSLKPRMPIIGFNLPHDVTPPPPPSGTMVAHHDDLQHHDHSKNHHETTTTGTLSLLRDPCPPTAHH